MSKPNSPVPAGVCVIPASGTCRSPSPAALPAQSFSRLPGLSLPWIWERGGASSVPTHPTRVVTRPTLLEEDGLGLGLTMGSCHSSPGFCSEPAPGMLREREGGSKSVLEAPAHESLDHGGAFLLFVLSCASPLPRGRGSTQIPEP